MKRLKRAAEILKVLSHVLGFFFWLGVCGLLVYIIIGLIVGMFH
jgi:hypothetical protein